MARGKTYSDNQVTGREGEALVKARLHSIGFAFNPSDSMEAGIDGTLEIRDPVTRAATGKTIAVQVKTTTSGSYTRETDTGYDLLRRALEAYRRHHKHFPARLVVYKTARFNPAEVEGFEAAIDEARIDVRDFGWVHEGSPLLAMREGDYPPLRGSVLELRRETMLYTRGSVPFFKTYPGMRVPRPIMLRPHLQDSTSHELAAETLALTKMNWNSTPFDGASPITLRAARCVGRILRHVPQGFDVQGDYRYYI